MNFNLNIMKENRFIQLRKKKWSSFEKKLDVEKLEANDEQIVDLYIELADDLAFAQTYYPKSTTETYLNRLTAKVHSFIHSSKTKQKGRVRKFYAKELPLLFNQCKTDILISFFIFFISAIIGWVSVLDDQEFIRIVLGDNYVNKTISNIDKNDPLAVYKQTDQVSMFLGITVNNIRVSFLLFLSGILTPLFTTIILFNNGLMLGSFFAFFYTRGLLPEALSSVWIHGVPEIFALIVAGGAGIIMGRKLVFPGTYTRMQSFINGSRIAVKLGAGLIPVFIYAGFLEGFVTRYTGLSYSGKIFIILFSVLLISSYFILLPKYLNSKYHERHHSI